MAFDAGAAIGRVILDTSKFADGVDTVDKGNKKIGSSLGGLGGMFLNLAKKAGEAFINSAKAADGFQKKVANVATLVDTSTVDVGKMATELLSLSGRLGDAGDLTGALYQALSASVEPAKAVEFVAESAKFAGAAMISTQKSVDILTTSINAYGAENLSASEASDKLFSIIKLGKTDGNALSAVIGKSIPLAANMGVSFDELGASIAIMTRQGVTSAAATTQFNSVLSAFLKPSTDMTAAIKELGFESGSAAIEQLGFKGAMDAVIKTTDGSKDATAKLFRNTNALKGVMALTGQAAKDYNNVLTDIKNSAGEADKAFQKQEITWDTLSNQMGKIEIIMGGVAKSFIDEIAVGATTAADGMIRFLLAGQGADILTSIIGGVVAVFDATKTALKPLVDILFPSISDLVSTLANALNRMLSPAGDTAGVFKVIAGVIQIAGSVIKIFVVGVKALINNLVNLVLAIKQSGGIIEKFFDVLKGKGTFSDVKEQIRQTGRAFEVLAKEAQEGFTLSFDTIGEEIKAFKKTTEENAEKIEVAWTTTFNRAKTNSLVDFQKIITGWGGVTDAVGDGADKQAQDVAASAEIIRLANGQILNEALNNYTSQQVAFRSLTQDQIDQIGKVSDMQGAIADAQIEQNEKLRQSTIDTWNSVAETITPIFTSIGAAITKGESVWEAFKKAGLNAIGAIIEGFAKQWAVLAVAAFIPGPTFNPAAGAGYAAAAAAGYVAAGALSAFESGGYATPGQAIVGEAGPEIVQFNKGANVIPNDKIGGFGNDIVFNNTFNVYNNTDVDKINQSLGRLVRSAVKG